MSAVRVSAPRLTLLAPRARLRRCVAARGVAGLTTRCDSRQLGTARLPADTNVEAFASSMFQWATSLTLQGANLPFVLPQRVDRLQTGFSVRVCAGVVCAVRAVRATCPCGVLRIRCRRVRCARCARHLSTLTQSALASSLSCSVMPQASWPALQPLLLPWNRSTKLPCVSSRARRLQCWTRWSTCLS